MFPISQQPVLPLELSIFALAFLAFAIAIKLRPNRFCHPMSIHQYVCLLGTHIPWYGICVGTALLGIGIWMIYNFEKFAMNEDQQNEILFCFPYMVLTGVLIAFLLDAFFYR